jgi:hypothetical protein
MTSDRVLHEGQILTGALFNEPMRVETVASSGPSTWTVGLVGTQTQQFRRVALTKDQLATLTILSPYWLGIDALTHPMRLQEDDREP